MISDTLIHSSRIHCSPGPGTYPKGNVANARQEIVEPMSHSLDSENSQPQQQQQVASPPSRAAPLDKVVEGIKAVFAKAGGGQDRGKETGETFTDIDRYFLLSLLSPF